MFKINMISSIKSISSELSHLAKFNQTLNKYACKSERDLILFKWLRVVPFYGPLAPQPIYKVRCLNPSLDRPYNRCWLFNCQTLSNRWMIYVLWDDLQNGCPSITVGVAHKIPHCLMALNTCKHRCKFEAHHQHSMTSTLE